MVKKVKKRVKKVKETSSEKLSFLLKKLIDELAKTQTELNEIENNYPAVFLMRTREADMRVKVKGEMIDGLPYKVWLKQHKGQCKKTKNYSRGLDIVREINEDKLIFENKIKDIEDVINRLVPTSGLPDQPVNYRVTHNMLNGAHAELFYVEDGHVRTVKAKWVKGKKSKNFYTLQAIYGDQIHLVDKNNPAFKDLKDHYAAVVKEYNAAIRQSRRESKRARKRKAAERQIQIEKGYKIFNGVTRLSFSTLGGWIVQKLVQATDVLPNWVGLEDLIEKDSTGILGAAVGLGIGIAAAYRSLRTKAKAPEPVPATVPAMPTVAPTPYAPSALDALKEYDTRAYRLGDEIVTEYKEKGARDWIKVSKDQSGRWPTNVPMWVTDELNQKYNAAAHR